MVILPVITICVLLFAAQLAVCQRAEKKWKRVLPSVLTVGFDAACWGMYVLGRTMVLGEIPSIKLGFTGMVLGGFGLYWIAGVLLAWPVYGIVRWIQKKKQDRE